MRLNLLCFVLGVIFLQNQAELPPLVYAFFWPLIFLISMFLASVLPREILLKIFFFGAGFFYAATAAHQKLSHELPLDWEGRDMEIIGVVSELPLSDERGQIFKFGVEKVLTPGATAPGNISLSSYYETEKTEFHPGQKWRLWVRLKRPHGNANPYGFDYEYWLLERGIRAGGYVRKSVGLLDSFVVSPSSLVECAREKIRDRIKKVLPNPGVLTALAIGEQRAISPEEWTVFNKTGVTHLMSISGLHVTMVAGLFYFLVYFLWRRSKTMALRLPARKAAVLAGVLAAFFYAFLAGFSVPTQRTVYMLSIVAIALWRGKISSSFSVLSYALLFVVLFDPWSVLSPGFWLSFWAVFLIMQITSSRLRPANGLFSAIHIQWAVTIGLIPILLVFFQQISLVSPVANAFSIPVVSLAVVPLTLLGAVLPMDFLLLAAQKIFSWDMFILDRLSLLPEAVWAQHSPPLWAAVAAMAGVVWLLLPRGFPARWVGLFFLFPLFLIFPETPPTGGLKLSILDVGQGLSIVAQTKSHTLLFDAGPAFSPQSDSGNRIIVPFLRGEGIQKLDILVLSHEDSDHTGGASSVLSSIPVGILFSSIKENGELCHAGQKWTWDNVVFEFLNPGLDSYSNLRVKGNLRSCVLRIAADAGAVLIAGDIETDIEKKLLSQRIQSELLVVPHHGGISASSPGFVQAVNPRYALFSVGYKNRFGHPRKEILARYAGREIHRTDLEGEITAFFADDIRIESWRYKHKRYWMSL